MEGHRWGGSRQVNKNIEVVFTNPKSDDWQYGSKPPRML